MPLGAAAEVATAPDADWSLKIVQFNVGQADAAIILAPNGDAAIVDMGETAKHADMILSYLKDPDKTGLKTEPHVRYIFASHYDGGHIGGAGRLHAANLQFDMAFDQGPSLARQQADGTFTKVYSAYLELVGDPNGNGKKDPGENDFRRSAARDLVAASQPIRMGADKEVELHVVSVCGHTRGQGHDIDLDPSKRRLDENPGSIIMLVRYGEFEFLTTGDATSND